MNDIQHNRYLQLENKQLQAENARLRKKLRETSRHAGRIRKARDDALLLASFANGGIIPSLRYARTHQMSRRQWQNAVALLRLAGVVRPHPGYGWLYQSLTEIEWRIDAIIDIAIDSPDTFKAHLSRHGNHVTPDL